ncbi:MAG: TAT-variant-translocated molybdopterin oxidoreductase [Myxococcales bacterium]|nr:TAT-variant-translocated molybdopterin oxidoreductase [Myxococcales bacterium]
MSRRKPYEFEGPAPSASVYWTSLDDLTLQKNPTAESQEALTAEFPEKAWDFSDAVSRRSFMTLMGASVALGTLQGCRRPEDHVMPYVRQPEDVTVNVANFYATVIDRRGEGVGLLIESHEGRPTKVEGNPDHAGSLGKTDLLAQSSVLDLYDPDRLRQPMQGAELKNWHEFETALRAALAAHAGNQGEGLRLLVGPSISPTFQRVRALVETAFPRAKFHFWDAANTSQVRLGAKLAFGNPLVPSYDLARAETVLALDSDFLQTETGAVRNTRGFAAGRSLDGASMSRLYVVEPTMTTTGGNADHRLRLAARDVGAYLKALAARLVSEHHVELGGLTAAVQGATAPAGVDAKWVNAVAKDLAEHREHGAILVGARQPAAVHALAHALNLALGNVGATVRFTPGLQGGDALDMDEAGDIGALAEALGNGSVQTLLVLGGNPAYDAPSDLEFGQKIARARVSFHLTSHRNETSELCTWSVPRAHYLEAWGDAQSVDGTVAVQQPLIDPLFKGRSDIEVLALVASLPSLRGHDLVRQTHRGDMPELQFDRQWRRFLNRGYANKVEAQNPSSVRAAEIGEALRQMPTGQGLGASNFEVSLHVDAKVLDGRYANNAWLQELPDPVTKITWDNAAYLSPATATALGVHNGDMVRVSKGNNSIEIAAWVLPGQADFVVGLNLGWGRTRAGRVGNGRGFSVNKLRTVAAPWFFDGARVEKISGHYSFSQTQDHHRMEGRPIAIESTFAQYRENPNFAARRSPTPRTLPLWREVEYNAHKWGMAIDLNLCTGCNACVVACQAENNIPVVGKEQVARGREMHWLRVDRYFVSPRRDGHDSDAEATSDPAVAFQPLACVHCEEAPCENVCPVNATVHSPEGLNEMAYNRCIGTRYCANNCPYKVRRFNYLNWHNDGVYQPLDSDVPETVRMQMNPNVTVRFRGVMEKCTYCVQRIQNKKVESKRSNRYVERNGQEIYPLTDGELVTACQQACPANAIVFGDLNDSQSQVARANRDHRRYGLLAEIGTQPRTSYLAKIRNPNPEMLG